MPLIRPIALKVMCFPGFDVRLDRLSLSVACHIGPNATAVVCMKKLPEAY